MGGIKFRQMHLNDKSGNGFRQIGLVSGNSTIGKKEYKKKVLRGARQTENKGEKIRIKQLDKYVTIYYVIYLIECCI